MVLTGYMAVYNGILSGDNVILIDTITLISGNTTPI